MSSNSRKADSTPVNRSRKHLIERAKLLKKCGLQIERELHFGNWGNHMFPVLSGLGQKNSGNLLARKQIRPQVMLANLATNNALNGRAHFGGKIFDLVKPTPDSGLRDRLADFLGEFSRQCPLSASELDGLLDRNTMDSHAPDSDKNDCLMQQEHLSHSDKQTGHAYRIGMKTPDMNWKTLAARLTWAMEQAHVDDKEVARRITEIQRKKLPWQTIQGVRRGTKGKDPMSKYVAHIAHAIGCDAMWLASGIGEPYGSKLLAMQGPYGDLTTSAVEFARRWQALAPHLRSHLYASLLAFEALNETAPPESPAPLRKTPSDRNKALG